MVLAAGFSPLLAVFFFFLRLEKRVFSRFKPFSLQSYIIYQLGKENGLNRIFGKNKFFGILTIKFFLFVNQQVRRCIEKL